MSNQKEEWKIYKNVFDEFAILNLEKLRSQGHFDDLKSPLALGKEDNVFSAVKGDHEIIVKIYRLENCNFNKMYSYLAPDPRFHGLKKKRRLIIFSWVQREYRNLLKAREVVRVPAPIAVKDNILLMEFIGRDKAAPKLKDSPPVNPQDFFDKTIKGIKAMYDVGLVHADLSEFNILNFEEEPVFIDFSQSTTIEHPQAEEFLIRDLKNIAKHFEKYDIYVDDEKLLTHIIKKK